MTNYREKFKQAITSGRLRSFDITDFQVLKLARNKTEKQLEAVFRDLRKTTLSRIKSLEKSGLIDEAVAKDLKDIPAIYKDIHSTERQITKTEDLIRYIHKYALFLADPKKSSILGKKAHAEATIEGLQRAGWKFVNMSNIQDFQKFIETSSETARMSFYLPYGTERDENGERPFALERYFYEFQLNIGTLTFKDLPEKFKKNYYRDSKGRYTLRHVK